MCGTNTGQHWTCVACREGDWAACVEEWGVDKTSSVCVCVCVWWGVGHVCVCVVYLCPIGLITSSSPFGVGGGSA